MLPPVGFARQPRHGSLGSSVTARRPPASVEANETPLSLGSLRATILQGREPPPVGGVRGSTLEVPPSVLIDGGPNVLLLLGCLIAASGLLSLVRPRQVEHVL